MAEKGEYGGGYDKSDAVRDTGDSASKVSETWHEAKNDAAKERGWRVPKDRHRKGSNDSGK